MRIIGLLLILFASPFTAGAIKSPSTTDHAAIQTLIDRANALNKPTPSNPNIRDIETITKDLERETRAPDYLQNHGLVARLQVELKALKKQRDGLYQQAVRQTLLAYDLIQRDANGRPVMPTNTAVHPRLDGRRIEWILVYKDDEPRVLLDKAGKQGTIPAGNHAAGGLTGADGVTTLYGEFKSPADLAMLIYHERVHYEQFTTRGVGDKLNFDEREERAFRAQYQALKRFGLTPSELAVFEVYLAGDPNDSTKPGKIREHHDKARLDRLKGNLSLGLWSASEPANIQPRSKAEYTALLDEAKDFDSRLVDTDRELTAQANKAREAAEAAARRDHDERLRNTLIEMAQRSCADPGSVTQAELDALPDPYQEDFKTSQGTPRGLDVCAYIVYLDLGRGVSSERIGSQATPRIPADIRAIPPQPQGDRTNRELVDAGATVPFNSIFPLLRDLAVTACSSPAQVSVDAGRLRRGARASFSRSMDDAVAAGLSTGLGNCPRQLFYALIETMRAGQASSITDQWVRSMAAVYSPPAYVPPPSGGGDPCRDNRNIRCP